MINSSKSSAEATREHWEKELLGGGYWGWGGRQDRAEEELARLRSLWEAAQPLDATQQRLTRQVLAVRSCNWQMEETILALCEGIGKGQPIDPGHGHRQSISQDRWQQTWAYYLACRS